MLRFIITVPWNNRPQSAQVAQWVRSLDYLTTHTSLSPIRRGFRPGFVNYKKAALDSQPQVIKFTNCLSRPWSVVLSRYSGFFQHQNWSPRYSWNIAESGVNTKNQSICLQVYLNRWAYEDNVVGMTCLWQVYQIKRFENKKFQVFWSMETKGSK